MKPTPPGWPRISNSLFYLDARAAIEWLVQAFDFEVRLVVKDDAGEVQHSELTFGEGLIMVGSEVLARQRPDGQKWKSPRSLGGANTASLFVYVDDVDAHCERARAAGARILKEPATTDYGAEYWSDRSYGCEDPEGHHWWFAQRIRTAGL